ncbi:MAG: hypothetical protein ACD_19C00427G0011 [uncultured bacterium]|nr:MAG: hypothetical protein ACD_19C00427G0011 [uncultured bacterium]
MEQDQTTQSEVAQQGPPQSSTFSQQSKVKNGSSKWLIIFIGLLILGGAGIFFFTKSANSPVATPTSSFGVTPIEDRETSTPAPTKSPEPVKKSEISIEIQNGTGITGEAKLLQDKLKTLGYSDITVGNASSTDNTETTVTFLKTLSQTAQDEIKKMLEGFYKTVNVKTSSTQKSDVVIITGLRGNQTTKPSATATPRASSTASPSATATPTGI